MKIPDSDFKYEDGDTDDVDVDIRDFRLHTDFEVEQQDAIGSLKGLDIAMDDVMLDNDRLYMKNKEMRGTWILFSMWDKFWYKSRELKRTNPDTTVKLELEGCTDPTSETRQFKRIYVSLGGSLKKGFKAIGRDLLGLDGAFLKSAWPGQLLTAVSLDPNNGYYPVANAAKGLIQVVDKLFPSAEHRFCVRHIEDNLRTILKGKIYKDALWKLARCRAMSDVLANNMCECFNSKLVDGRDKPIITLSEYIREYLMRKIVNVLKVIDRSSRLPTPYATQMTESVKKEASRYSVHWNGEDHYQVTGPNGDQYVVNMTTNTCACRRCEITGIPCRHVVTSIWVKGAHDRTVGRLETFVNPIYTMDRWKEVYSYKV
ncbi:uncharacterized protein LOC143555760 [Bidens hawaiensis]|uniref:uncharacterized protein LOC143555760 n=1 Tax=Bidens hawaiensis TaxID=980011 RepID=UPI00404AB68D